VPQSLSKILERLEGAKAYLPELSPEAHARINAVRERSDGLIEGARREHATLIRDADRLGEVPLSAQLRKQAQEILRAAQDKAAVQLLDAQAEEYLPLTGSRFPEHTLEILARTSAEMYGGGDAVILRRYEWRARWWEQGAADKPKSHSPADDGKVHLSTDTDGGRGVGGREQEEHPIAAAELAGPSPPDTASTDTVDAEFDPAPQAEKKANTESRQPPTPRQPLQQHPVSEPNSAGGNPPQVMVKGAVQVARAARSEIENFAMEAFAVARNRIVEEHAEKKRSVLAQVGRTHNSGGYVPALTKWGAECVREMILAQADAYVDAFTTFEVPSDVKAEESLKTASVQIAGGSISGIRGQLDLIAKRTRMPLNDSVGHINREIEKSRLSALKEGVLRLRRQRIKAATTQTQLAPVPAPPSLPIPLGQQHGMVKDNIHRSPNVVNLGELMRRLGKDWNWEISPEFVKAFEDNQGISAEGYKRILRIAGKMETRKEFISRLPELLAEMGLKLPSGVLRLPPVPTSTAKSDKGNLEILRTDGQLRRAVTLDVARRFGGVTRRAIEDAARKGTLKTEGKRQQRRVLVESLLKYFPPEK